MRLGVSIRVTNAGGASLLEMVLCLALLGPLVWMMGAGVRHAVCFYLKARQEYRNQYVYLRTINLLEGLMRGVDSHPFWIQPRIHAGSQITLIEGASNSINASLTTPPAPDSDAITVLALDLLATQRVVRAERQGRAVVLFACSRFGKDLSERKYMSFAGLSLDGFAEFQGEYRPHPGRLGCFDFILILNSGMSLKSTDDPLNLREVIPISFQYTIYVDQRGQLRLLSHRGEINVENQPLLAGIKSLSMGLESVFGGKIYMLKGEIEFPQGRRRSFQIIHRIGRQGFYNFLLNHP